VHFIGFYHKNYDRRMTNL